MADIRTPILFLSLPRHDENYTSTPWQMAEQLAKTHEVLFIDNPFTLLDLIFEFRKSTVRKRLMGYLGRKWFMRDGVTVILSPFVFPSNFLPKGFLFNLVTHLNHLILARRIRQVLRERHITSVIYINSFVFRFPRLQDYLSSVLLNIYHCIDPMVKAFTLKHGPYMQDIAARNANFIISTSPSLQEQFRKPGFPKSYYVPNAANVELFAQALEEGLPMQARVAAITGKVMGYLGNIERRTDTDLLLRTLEALPDWTLVMAGPVEHAFIPMNFLNHPRIIFTGPVHHDDAPGVIKRFDVAIIPFKCDEVSSGIYPLKLYEYLAAGKPVVTTYFNREVLDTISDQLFIARNAEQFPHKILEAYATDDESKIQDRYELAKANSWSKRAKQFENIVLYHLSHHS